MRTMRRRLRTWVAAGLLSQEQAERILAAEARPVPPERVDRTALAATAAALAAASALCFVLVLSVTQPDGREEVPPHRLLLGVGATALAAALALPWLAHPPRRAFREAALAGAATALSLVAFLSSHPPLWAALPGFVLVNAALAVDLLPETRLGLAALAPVATLALVDTAGGDPWGGGLIVLPVALHVLALWSLLPPGSPYRTPLALLLAAGALAAAGTGVRFLFDEPTLRRLGFVVAAGALAAALLALGFDPRLRRRALPLRPLALPGS